MSKELVYSYYRHLLENINKSINDKNNKIISIYLSYEPIFSNIYYNLINNEYVEFIFDTEVINECLYVNIGGIYILQRKYHDDELERALIIHRLFDIFNEFGFKCITCNSHQSNKTFCEIKPIYIFSEFNTGTNLLYNSSIIKHTLKSDDTFILLLLNRFMIQTELNELVDFYTSYNDDQRSATTQSNNNNNNGLAIPIQSKNNYNSGDNHGAGIIYNDMLCDAINNSSDDNIKIILEYIKKAVLLHAHYKILSESSSYIVIACACPINLLRQEQQQQ